MPDPPRCPTSAERLADVLADVRELKRLDCEVPVTEAARAQRALARARVLWKLEGKVSDLGEQHLIELDEAEARGHARGCRETADAFGRRDAKDAQDDGEPDPCPTCGLDECACPADEALTLAEAGDLPVTAFGGPEPGEQTC